MIKAATISLATALLVGCAAPGSEPRPRPSALADFSGALGQSTRVGSRTVTPVAILEDSRCPANANCVQAGTVRLQLSVGQGSGTQAGEIGLGRPLAIEGEWLHLVGICPHPIAPNPVPPASYRFRFALKHSAVPPPVAADCT